MKRRLWALATGMVVSGFVASASPAQSVYDLDTWNGNIRIMGDDASDRSGSSVSSGDINGDGIGDIIIGAHQADPEGGAGAGEVYVIYGRIDAAAECVIDLNAVPADITVYGDDSYDHSGFAVVSGDINGDGVDDVIFGAHGSAPAGGGDAGEVHVIYGSGSFPVNHTIDLNAGSADISIYGDDVLDLCGESVWSGDVNGDGVDDILIGAGGSTPAPMAGKAYAVYGSRSFPDNHVIDLNSVSADVSIYGAESGDRLGASVSGGDVNGDGIDDMLIGAPRPGLPWQTRKTGKVYVIYGRTSFPVNHTIELGSSAADITLSGRDEGDFFGQWVSCGDINDDGIDDIIAGAQLADPAGGDDAGQTCVVYGSRSFPADHTLDLRSHTADVTVNGDDAGDYSGHSGSVGDINGDGIDDMIIGAYGANTGAGDDVGETYVIYGNRFFPISHTIDLDSVPADVIVYGDDAMDRSGWAVSSGDVNGDGLDDLLIGAYSANPTGGVGAGETYVIYGVHDVSVEEHEAPQPTRFALSQNFPNPFNLSTTIRYTLPEAKPTMYDAYQRSSLISLKIYNLLGQMVRTLVEEIQEPGSYTVTWDGKDNEGRQAPSGVYFYHLSATGTVVMKRMVLTK
ncbi:MAG: FG-GAP repeat protein [Gemmatimonadota bacterium]|nr:MAG: FG-GAP repeat protein [Gemmatimonadota bacterium]